jgi:hypothetical protein
VSIGWLAPALVALLGLVLIKVAWRASLTIFVALAVDLIGMLGAVIPPVVMLNQVIGHGLIGAVLGAAVHAGREREEIRRLPLLASSSLLILTASWVGSLADLLGSAWLFAVRVLVLPGIMYGAIRLGQFYSSRVKAT